jgi:hypothetical protein
MAVNRVAKMQVQQSAVLADIAHWKLVAAIRLRGIASLGLRRHFARPGVFA